eukprot:5626203-Amphidinium_carterae.3
MAWNFYDFASILHFCNDCKTHVAARDDQYKQCHIAYIERSTRSKARKTMYSAYNISFYGECEKDNTEATGTTA